MAGSSPSLRLHVALETALAPPAVWRQVLDELASSDACHGLVWPARSGAIRQLEAEVSEHPATHLVIDAERHSIRRTSVPIGWGDGTSSEVVISVTDGPSGGSLVSLQVEGYQDMIQSVVGPSDEDVLGWALDQVLSVVSRAAGAQALGDWLTDRLARRPQSARARLTDQHPMTHLPGLVAIVEALALRPNDRLLEIGCGGGVLLDMALASGCAAIGVDHRPQMIRLSHQRNQAAVGSGRLVLIPGQAEALPLPDLWVTAVAMATAFFFLPDPLAVLRECGRVLRPSGRLAVFTISPELRGTPAAPEPMASRGRLYSDQELAAVAIEAGFSDVTVSRTANGGQLLAARKP